jgi:hypothetical protein
MYLLTKLNTYVYLSVVCANVANMISRVMISDPDTDCHSDVSREHDQQGAGPPRHGATMTRPAQCRCNGDRCHPHTTL